MISDKAKKITEKIYLAYGTDSGILFGIPSDKRSIVEAIVSATLRFTEDESDKKEENING